MCFHISNTAKVSQLEERFHVQLHNDEAREAFDTPVYHANGFAHPAWLLIPQQAPDKLVYSTWGIVPENKKAEDISDYHKQSVRYGGGLNAQSEKLFHHFLYQKSALTKRCIIPVTGFFEPHENKKKKYPYYISRTDQDLLPLAGIYTLVEDIVTFTILTKVASPLFEKIHNLKKRQPIILPPELEKEWLRSDLNEQHITEILQSSYNDTELNPYTVSKDLFSPKVNSDTQHILDKVPYPIPAL